MADIEDKSAKQVHNTKQEDDDDEESSEEELGKIVCKHLMKAVARMKFETEKAKLGSVLYLAIIMHEMY